MNVFYDCFPVILLFWGGSSSNSNFSDLNGATYLEDQDTIFRSFISLYIFISLVKPTADNPTRALVLFTLHNHHFSFFFKL
jgi:hypothetical protein